MTQASPAWRQQLNWQVFNSLFGEAFYQYARSESFLRSFSERQLFANSAAVDRGWLEMLQAGAANRATRHAVLAFLAGFWRQDYTAKIEAITLPTLVVVGDRASSISRSGEGESPDERLSAYLHHLPNGQAVKIPGRNVLPYENTQEFVSAIASFVREIGQF
jgi:pimeloyl-ACP methyl ester carboxylesterase